VTAEITTTALADVLALHDRPGLLSPPLAEFAGRPSSIVAPVTTVTIVPGPHPHGAAFDELYAVLDRDLSDRVVVLGGAAGVQAAIWGQILSRACHRSGALGVLVDGQIRDRALLAGEQVVVWARGECTVGGTGQAHIAAVDGPVDVGAVLVHPDDTAVIDRGGVIVLDRNSAGDLLAQARTLAQAEEELLVELERGAALSEAYEHKREALRHIREASGIH
jgi:regulator of RNase E activity RraA